MKLYITLRSIPQFSDLPKDELKKKYRYYLPMLLNHWLIWVTLGISSFSFVTLEWVIRYGAGEFQLNPISVWYAVPLRIGLYFIIGFLCRITVYGIIASRVNQDATTMQPTPH